jgi:hypothetical protein
MLNGRGFGTYLEPLVHVQREDQDRVCDSVCMRFGVAVWRECRWRGRDHGESNELQRSFVDASDADSCFFLSKSRPFGVALLIAGVDEKGPQL